jgi:hypothetical protein
MGRNCYFLRPSPVALLYDIGGSSKTNITDSLIYAELWLKRALKSSMGNKSF